MFDAEKFIKAVESKPTIWKSDDNTFSNRVLKRRAWEDVARKMCANFDSFTERNKDNLIVDLQKKWRNYRDYHIKLRKAGKVVKRKSSYLTLMSFLDEVIMPDKKISRRNIDSDDDDDDEESNQSRKVPSKNYYNENTDEPSKRSEFINNSAQATNYTDYTDVACYFEDPDRSFLISLLPDMKSMEEKQKFFFKLETMKLLEKIKYGSDEMYDVTSEGMMTHDPLVNNPKLERMDTEIIIEHSQ